MNLIKSRFSKEKKSAFSFIRANTSRFNVKSKKSFLQSISEPVSILFSTIVGSLFYSIVFGGLHSLSQSNISFLQGDSSANYISQLFYLRDKWHFPLAANPTYGLEMSVSTSLDGGPPILLMIQKLLKIAPEKQLYGIFILICLILHHHFARKILKEMGLSVLTQNFYAILFFLPFLFFRLEMHPLSAGVHWPLLWAFLVVIKDQRRRQFPYLESIFLILLSYSIFINTCFLVLLILFFTILQKITHVGSTKAKIQEITKLLIIWISALFFMAFAMDGFLLRGAKDGVQQIRSSTSGGFGLYNFNLVSFFNPDTGIRDNWYFKPGIGNVEGWSYNFSSSGISLGTTYGAYEGFAYLGLGVLILVLITYITVSKSDFRTLWSSKITNASVTWMVLIGIYAASGIRISIGNFDFPPPGRGRFYWHYVDQLIPFRSSGRAIWILAYGLLISCVYILSRKLNSMNFVIVLIIVLMCQTLDLSKPLENRFLYASKRSLDNSWITEPPTKLQSLSEGKKFLRIIPVENHTDSYQDLGYWAWSLGLQTDSNYSARYNWELADIVQQESIKKICEQKVDRYTIYAVLEGEIWKKLKSNCDLTEYIVWRHGNRYFLSTA